MFGDTLRDEKFSGAGFVRNSMLLVEPDCLQVVLPESGGAIIPDREEGVGYWPMSVTTLDKPGYALVVVAAQRVRTTDSDDADTRDGAADRVIRWQGGFIPRKHWRAGAEILRG